MTRCLRTGLLAGASAVALVSTAISPASAFDRVHWTWDATITENVTKNVVIGINMTPTGLVMVEDLQVSIGDIDAYSEVSNVDNNQPLDETFQGGEIELQFRYDSSNDPGTLDPNEADFNSDEITAATVDEGADEVQLTVDLGQLAVATFNAVDDLPEVVSTATAVANNTTITSGNPVELHEGQFAFNVQEGGSENIYEVPPLALSVIPDENTNLGGAALLTWYALNGSTMPAQVQAISDVDGILNASVDSSATAVANNLSVTVEPAAETEALVMADIVQFSHANVYADSLVSDVELHNYTNLGLADDSIGRPIVSSVATAVGNNKTITVNIPE